MMAKAHENINRKRVVAAVESVSLNKTTDVTPTMAFTAEKKFGKNTDTLNFDMACCLNTSYLLNDWECV